MNLTRKLIVLFTAVAFSVGMIAGPASATLGPLYQYHLDSPGIGHNTGFPYPANLVLGSATYEDAYVWWQGPLDNEKRMWNGPKADFDVSGISSYQVCWYVIPPQSIAGQIQVDVTTGNTPVTLLVENIQLQPVPIVNGYFTMLKICRDVGDLSPGTKIAVRVKVLYQGDDNVIGVYKTTLRTNGGIG